MRAGALKKPGCFICSGLAHEAAPRPQALHHLVSWLESWASLTRLCTSISVLSLLPDRSFSAPICSRTAERCSAVHFRTKGFLWLRKIQSRSRAQTRNGVWCPQIAACGPTVVPPCFTP